MANLIALVAASGSGKSTSLFPNPEIGIKGLNPKETVIINVAHKPLPVKGALKMYPPDKKLSEGGNYLEISDASKIKDAIIFINQNRPDVKNVVIDDFTYIFSFDVMERSKETGFNKWTDLAKSVFDILNAARTMRRDLNIICINHSEKGDDGLLKLKTAGRLLDNTVYLDGLFTFILYAVANKNYSTNKIEYAFRTKSDGTSTCKTPVGCFDEELIPNDMGLVLDKIKEYYEG